MKDKNKKRILIRVIISLTLFSAFIVCAANYAPGFDNWPIVKFISNNIHHVSSKGRFCYTGGVAVGFFRQCICF